jgi:hypothetical protein
MLAFDLPETGLVSCGVHELCTLPIQQRGVVVSELCMRLRMGCGAGQWGWRGWKVVMGGERYGDYHWATDRCMAMTADWVWVLEYCKVGKYLDDGGDDVEWDGRLVWAEQMPSWPIYAEWTKS